MDAICPPWFEGAGARRNCHQNGISCCPASVAICIKPDGASLSAPTAKLQEWLGHANIATTRVDDRRKMRPEDSPSLKVSD